MEILIIVAVVVVVLLLLVIGVYNRLVKMRENVREAWKSISIALEQRLRSIGGLIDTAKTYMDFEKGTLGDITKARTGLASALQSGDAKAAYAANESLQNALPALNVAVEAYPDLKSSGLMENVQNEFSQSAGKIASSQNYFNGSVREYNKQILVFPNVIFAGIFGFKQETYYEADETTQSKVNDADMARELKF